MSDRKNNTSKPLGESRFVNSFLRTHRGNNDNEHLQQSKRPRLDVAVCLSGTISTSNKTKVDSEQTSSVNIDSYWEEDIDISAVDEVLKASQAFMCDVKEPSDSACNVTSDSGTNDLLSKPIVKNGYPSAIPPRLPPSNAAAHKHAPSANVQQHHQQKSVPSKAVRNQQQQRPSKVPFIKAASAGNLKNSLQESPLSSSSSSSSSSAASLSAILPYTSRQSKDDDSIKNKIRENSAEIQLQSELRKMNVMLTTATEKLQNKEGETSLLRSHIAKCKMEKDKMERHYKSVIGTYDEKFANYEMKLAQSNTDLNFKMMELKGLQEKCRTYKVEMKRLSAENVKSHTTDAAAAASTSCHPCSRGQSTLSEWSQRDMVLTPAILTQTTPHDGRSLIENCTSMFSGAGEIPLLDVPGGGGDGAKGAYEDSWLTYYSMLGRCHSFASGSAAAHVKKFLKICCQSLEEIVKTVNRLNARNRARDLYQRWHGIAPLNKDYSLLDPNRWYPEENGVTPRRLLGMTTALVDVSADIVRLILPPSLLSPASDCDEDGQQADGEKKESLLHVLRDCVKYIADECGTIQYNGVLAGAVSLITSVVESEQILTADGQKLVLDIARWVLLCSPGPTVILLVCKFIFAADEPYPLITNSLCHNRVIRPIKEYDEFNQFHEDTCLITVMCSLVQGMKNDTKLFLISDVLTTWFYCIYSHSELLDEVTPDWLDKSSTRTTETSTGRENKCECQPNLFRLILGLLRDAAVSYDNERSKMPYSERCLIELLLGKGISLLYMIIETTKGVDITVGETEGHYELFIDTVIKYPDLSLSVAQRYQLKILEEHEAKKSPEPNVVDCDNEEMKNLFSRICTI